MTWIKLEISNYIACKVTCESNSNTLQSLTFFHKFFQIFEVFEKVDFAYLLILTYNYHCAINSFSASILLCVTFNHILLILFTMLCFYLYFLKQV